MIDARRKQAVISLGVRLRRTSNLVEELAGDFSTIVDLEKKLQMQSAAFHNFKVADVELNDSHVDLSKEQATREAARELIDQQKKLFILVEKYRRWLLEEQNKVSHIRRKIARFRSGPLARQGDGEYQFG